VTQNRGLVALESFNGQSLYYTKATAVSYGEAANHLMTEALGEKVILKP
jgi:hypothetical protein